MPIRIALNCFLQFTNLGSLTFGRDSIPLHLAIQRHSGPAQYVSRLTLFQPLSDNAFKMRSPSLTSGRPSFSAAEQKKSGISIQQHSGSRVMKDASRMFLSSRTLPGQG